MRNQDIHRRLDEIARQGPKYIYILHDLPHLMLTVFLIGVLVGLFIAQVVYAWQ